MLRKIKNIINKLFISNPAIEEGPFVGHPKDWPKTQKDYEEFWASKEAMVSYFEPSRIAFYKEVMNFIPKKTGKVLDIGCGDGYFLTQIAKRDKHFGNNFTGIDYASSGFKKAEKLLPKARFIQADASQLPFNNNYFNLIIIMETFEHLENWDMSLKEAMRTLKKKGKLFITIPDGEKDSWVGHTNFWSERAFAKIIAPYGKTSVVRLDEDRTLLGIIIKK